MKHFLYAIIAVFSLIACSKEGNGTDSFLTDYVIGNNYKQTFFVGSHAIWGSGGKLGTSYHITSICQRLSFSINPDSEIFDDARPPQEMYNAVIRKNEKQKDTELKYYVIADFEFSYDYTLTNIKRLSEWTTVIGKEEEYVLNGNIYKRIVIVEKVQLEY